MGATVSPAWALAPVVMAGAAVGIAIAVFAVARQFVPWEARMRRLYRRMERRDRCASKTRYLAS